MDPLYAYKPAHVTTGVLWNGMESVVQCVSACVCCVCVCLCLCLCLCVRHNVAVVPLISETWYNFCGLLASEEFPCVNSSTCCSILKVYTVSC